ncbi:MAG: heparinase II/III family protein, partial [Verrucomicrobia bacterium]|nr:heparinase II/III family protein [Verrucomicrobiota bacterium]
TSWDKTTLAHSTLIVDEQSQAPAQGRCLAFGAAGGVDYAMTEAGPIYPGVRFVRTAALLSENLIVIVDQVCAGQEHQFDIACHLAGKWSRLPEGEPWTPPGANGYRHIARAVFRSGASGMTGVALLESGGESALTLAGGEPTQFITGTGIGASTEDRVPIALLRRRAKETAFVWAVALDGKPVQLETLAARDADGKTLLAAAATAVTVRSGDKRWALLVNPAGQPVQASLPEGTWTSSELFAVRAP